MEEQAGLKFSIITVCYNEEKTISASMETVLNQTWKNIEYIIVDGASDDSTLEIVQQYAAKDERVRWYSERDNGVFDAMNKGICHAKGDYLFFLNAGDRFHSDDVLEEAAEAIIAQQADIAIGDVVFKRKSDFVKHIYAVGEELRENLEKGDCVCHQVVFASKASLEGGFDEQFVICADYDWLCRQVNAHKKIIKIDKVITDYDVYGISNQVRYDNLHWKECFQVIRKNFPKAEFATCGEVEKLFIKNRKTHFLYEFMNRWLLLKQKGIQIASFFVDQGIYSIAIYGMHYMGQRLNDELEKSEVKVRYGMDKKAYKQEWNIPVIHPDEVINMESVDAIVVTPVFDYLEIKDELSKKMSCMIVSIEDVLYYQYEDA